MKKLVGLLIVMSLAASVNAGLDISFSTIDDGNWSYEASGEGSGTFSFTDASIDNINGVQSGPLGDQFVHIPDLYVSSLTHIDSGIYLGSITQALSTIAIKNSDDIVSLEGELNEGAILIFGTTAAFYPTLDQNDITNTEWTTGSGLKFILDFSLTLQGSTDIATMIEQGNDNVAGGSFSGSITVPEPATIFILAIGSVLLWKNE
jgi:hypothetical protein